MRFVLFAAVLVAFVAANAQAATIPTATYVKRADAVCLDVAKRALALRREANRRVAAAGSEPEVLRVFADIYARQLKLVEAMRRRIVAIGMPRGDEARATATRLVGGIRSGERALRQVIDAIESRSMAAAAQAVARYRDVSLSSARAVRDSELGFRYCGAGA